MRWWVCVGEGVCMYLCVSVLMRVREHAACAHACRSLMRVVRMRSVAVGAAW